MDKGVVADDHQARNGQLAQQRRKSDIAHVPEIAHREPHAFAAYLELHEPERPAAAEHVPKYHARTDDVTDARGDGGARQPPFEYEDEEVVEYDVDARRHDVAGHGESRRPVEPHDEHQDVEDGQRCEEQREPYEVFARRDHQFAGGAQQQEQRFVPMDQQGAEQGDQQRRKHQRLRDVDLRHASFALREVDRRHDRAAHAEHQSQPRAEREERRDDIDRGEGVAAYAPPYEDAVGDDEHGREDHAHDRGKEEAPEKFSDVRTAEIDTVSLHIPYFFRSGAKVRLSARGKVTL